MAEAQKASGDSATSSAMAGVESSEEPKKDTDDLEPPVETDMPTITLGDSLQIDGVDTPMDVLEPPALAAEPGGDPKKSLEDVESALDPVPTLSLGDSDPDPVAMKCNNSPAAADGKADDVSNKSSSSRDLASDSVASSEGDKVDSGLVNGVSDSDKESASSDKPAASSMDTESDKNKTEVTDVDGKVESGAEKPGDRSGECADDKPKETALSSSKMTEKSLPSRSSSRSRSKSVNYNENDFIPEIDVDTEECFIKKKQQEAPKVQNGLPVLTPVLPPSQVTHKPPVTPVAPFRSAPVVSHSVMPIAQPMPHKPVQVVSRTTPAIINPTKMIAPSVKPASLTPQVATSMSQGVSLLNAKLVHPGTVYQLYVPPVSAMLTQSGSIPLNQSIASSVLSSIVSQAASTIQTAANNRSILQSNVVSSTMATPRPLAAGLAATPNLLSQLKTANIPSNYKKPEPVEWVAPKSSWEMMELARFEVGNKGYKKPGMQQKPDAEMASVTRFLFDIGLDCIKESVYSELIHIQSRRKDEGKLKPKEEEDFNKLRTVHKEVKERIGHLRLPLNKRCKCGFRSESTNVLMHHQEFARQRENDLICCQCGWETRQPQAFAFHMESAHGCRGQVDEKPAFYRCALCPFETNLANKMKSHKVKCYRTFKADFNLSPHSLACNEINFCLENIFYSDNVDVMRKKQEQLQAAQQKLAAQQKRLLPKESAPAASNRLPSSLPLLGASSASLVTKATLQPFQNHFKLSPAQQHQGKLAVAAAQQFARQNPNLQYRGTVKQQLQAMQPQPGQPQQQKNVRALLSKMNMKVGMPQVAMPGSLTHLQQQQQAAVASRKGSSSGMTVSELLKARYPAPSQSSSQPRPSSSAFEVCEICGGYVKDRKALQVHFYYAHRIEMPQSVFERPQPPLYCATCFLRFWTAQGLQKHIDIHNNEDKNSVGVAGKCIICSHRVPNILMHMRHVHNRDLNNFLKGFKCVFCGQFFSGQQPMEAHMAQAHGVVVKITVAQGEKTITGTSAVSPAASSPSAQQQQQGSRGGSNNQMVKGSVCVLCNLNFGRNVDLTRHCMKEHHTCMKCGMVVADRVSLDRHVCLMSPVGLRNCTICGERGFHPAYYVKHLRDKHLRRCSVKLVRLTQKELRKHVRAPPPLNSPDSPIVLDDDDDSTRQDNSSDSSFSRQSRTAAAGLIVRAEASKRTSKQVQSSEPKKASDQDDSSVEAAKPHGQQLTSDVKDGEDTNSPSGTPEASRSAESDGKSSAGKEKGKPDSADSNHLGESAAAAGDEDEEPGENHTGKSVARELCESAKRPASPDVDASEPAEKKKKTEEGLGKEVNMELDEVEGTSAGPGKSSPADSSAQQKRGRETPEDDEDVGEAKRRHLDPSSA